MTAKPVFVVLVLVLALSAVAFAHLASKTYPPTYNGKTVEAPEFTHTAADEWINSGPLSVKDLRGSVVLLDFWTFDCWNCYRSFPWLKEVEAVYADRGLKVIGVHTPEFDHEKIRSNIVEKVKEFGLHHPVMIDNDFSYWNAMDNRYWPTFYLIDKHGFIRSVFLGETRSGSTRAGKIENEIKRLLDEA